MTHLSWGWEKVDRTDECPTRKPYATVVPHLVKSTASYEGFFPNGVAAFLADCGQGSSSSSSPSTSASVNATDGSSPSENVPPNSVLEAVCNSYQVPSTSTNPMVHLASRMGNSSKNASKKRIRDALALCHPTPLPAAVTSLRGGISGRFSSREMSKFLAVNDSDDSDEEVDPKLDKQLQRASEKSDKLSSKRLVDDVIMLPPLPVPSTSKGCPRVKKAPVSDMPVLLIKPGVVVAKKPLAGLLSASPRNCTPVMEWDDDVLTALPMEVDEQPSSNGLRWFDLIAGSLCGSSRQKGTVLALLNPTHASVSKLGTAGISCPKRKVTGFEKPASTLEFNEEALPVTLLDNSKIICSKNAGRKVSTSPKPKPLPITKKKRGRPKLIKSDVPIKPTTMAPPKSIIIRPTATSMQDSRKIVLTPSTVIQGKRVARDDVRVGRNSNRPIDDNTWKETMEVLP